MDNVSFCPYRTGIDWTKIQQTKLSQPVQFSGDARDFQSDDETDIGEEPIDTNNGETIEEESGMFHQGVTFYITN
jgi:hypothetical protein